MTSGKSDNIHGTIESSHMVSSFANVFEVFSTPGEIVLAFGVLMAVEPGQDVDLTAHLAHRIILSPHITKKLAILLANKIHAYEAVFDPLTKEVVSSAPEEEGSFCAYLPQYASEKTAEKANALIALIDGLDVEYGLERSFKISEHSLLMNRFIMGLKKDRLPNNSDESLSYVFRQMGMPDSYMDECRALLATTEFIHFGFEEQQHGCMYKVYLEFKIPLATGLGGVRVNQEPFLVFLGFKWDPFDNNTRAKTRYICYPLLSREEIKEKLACLFEQNPEYKSFETAQNILNESVRVVSNDKIIYEEVSEENNPRKSFDMNLYGASLYMRDIYPLLMDIGRHYSLPLDKFIPLCERISDKRFGHLSGGVDREGKDFLTVYYGVEEVTRRS